MLKYNINLIQSQVKNSTLINVILLIYFWICITIETAVTAFVIPANVPAFGAAAGLSLSSGFSFGADVSFCMQFIIKFTINAAGSREAWHAAPVNHDIILRSDAL